MIVISEAPTRVLVKKLRKAGFTSRPGKGSHTEWICPSGRHHISVPDGHKTISPGVHRKVLKVMSDCDCEES